jgi:hypothetical protein
MSPRIIRVTALLAVVLTLLAPAPPAGAESRSGGDSRPGSPRVFASTSPLQQRLPSVTPVAADSAALVASLDDQAHQYYGTPTTPSINVNTVRYTPALYVSYDSDPAYDITGWNCQRKPDGWDVPLNQKLHGVHIPDDLKPDPSSDGSVSIYNADSHDLVELWKAQKVDGAWQACWGGRITGTDQAQGTFGFPYGASASGLALWGLTIRQNELLAGRIDHVISLAIPRTRKGVVSWPANRTDGYVPGTELAIGQMLRLPSTLNLSAMKLSPAAMTIARAAQEYGIVIADTSGSVAFSAENPIALAKNSYDTVFRGRYPYQEMLGNPSKGEVAFPLDKLVALPIDYRVPSPDSASATNTTYAAAVAAAKPAIYWRLGDAGTVAADASGHGRAGSLRAVSPGITGAVAGDAAVQTLGTSASGVSLGAKTTPAKAFTVQVWFRSTTRAGGKILGFESSRTGSGSRADRSLYLTNDGRLAFGTRAKSRQTVVSAARFTDGGWHRATATQSSSGTRLYVDGVLVAKGSAKKAQAGSGYWRLGGGNLSGWPSRPASAWFAGGLDEFAYYPTALSAATIAAQYRAAR